ncbi:hypothetical protein ACLB2K_040644 [Fragaria x ananassa]
MIITEERNDNVMSDINQEPPSGPTKKVRGKTRGVNADKVFSQLNSKLPVTLTEQNGRPTGPYAEMFANEIGYTIRNHAPLNVEKWKKINKVDVDNMIKRMQIRSEKNVINRSQLKHHHKAGSKSFMSHQEQIAAQTGEIQGAIDRFETEYKSTKKGWDLGAKAKWDAMIKMRTETTEPDGTRTMIDDEICEKVLGVKSGYIKGCGFGPRPPPKRISHSSINEMSEKNKELQEQLQETQQLVGTQQQKIDAQNEVIQRLEEQAKKFEEFMANFNMQHPSA